MQRAPIVLRGNVFWVLFTILAFAIPAAAQSSNLDQVGFDQKLNTAADLDVPLRDESGQTVRLRELLHDRPTIVMLGFYSCPMLCDPLLQNLASSLKHLQMSAGKDFNVITLSIDPTEQPSLAAAKRASLLAAYAHPDSTDGWHCLTADAAAIDRFTSSVGFRYAKLPGGQFSHPAGLILLTPDGQISRYLLGMTFQTWELRLALTDAGQGKIGTVSDAVLLRCYHYDPATGRYGFAIQSALRISGCLTAASLFSLIGWLSFRHRQTAERLA